MSIESERKKLLERALERSRWPASQATLLDYYMVHIIPAVMRQEPEISSETLIRWASDVAMAAMEDAIRIENP